MANRKISDLTALTAPAAGDYLPVVDISEAAAADKNKRITIEELFRGVPLGTAAAPAIAIEGDENTGIYSPGADQLAISTGGTGRLFIDASGNIGVGATPLSGHQLTVNAASLARIALQTVTLGQTSSDGFALEMDSSGVYFTNRENIPSIFYTNNQERLRITSAGNVGIGTSSPGYALDVAGSGKVFANSGFRLGTSYSALDVATGASGLYLSGAEGVTNHVFINPSGRVGIGTTSPTNSLHVALNGTSGPRIRLQNTNSTSNNSELILAGPGGDIGGINADAGGNGGTDINLTANSASGFLRFNVGTGGTERMRITSAGNVGIGTTSPGGNLHINSSITRAILINNSTIGTANTDGTYFSAGSDGGFDIINQENSYTRFGTNGTERARIDSSGRLLVGTSSARTNFYNASNTNQLQVEGTNYQNSGASFICNGGTNPTNGPVLGFNKSNGTTVGSNTLVASGDVLGALSFAGNDGSEFVEAASIAAYVDGTPGANDMPGRLVFSTTADGAASPTERMRIDSSGRVGIGAPTPLYNLESASSNDVQISLTRNSVGRWLLGTTSTNNLKFDKEGGAEAMRLDASSRVLVGITSANTSGAKLQTADGITFPATQVASADPNTLDDYEEGTWTPALRGSGTAGTYELSRATGIYTKIGRQVTATLSIQLAGSITGGGTGYSQITGLPFNQAANSYPNGMCATFGVDISTNYTTLMFAPITQAGTTTWFLQEVGDNVAPNDLPIAAFSANDQVLVTFSYIV